MAAAAPTSSLDLLDLLQKSRIWPDAELKSRLAELGPVPDEPRFAAGFLIEHGLLTPFQARILMGGKYRGFRLGAYVIRSQVGQGGMGAVYLGHHEGLRRPVAIKVLTPPDKSAVTQVNVERFLREARSAAALDHPNIVRIFDVAQHGEMHYLVMEYVEGRTLDQMLTAGGPVACGRAVEYMLQVAAGLEHAHQKGFVHRDIKPANLILSKDGTVKILDMGLARSEDSADQVTEAFDKGAVVGTADYISPEQAMNAPDLDIRADIYSLGATFYTLLTGRPPFSGNTTQKLMQHQIKEAPPLDALDKTFPPDLARVVAKMMMKRPAERYQTPGEVMAALGPWLSNTSQVVAALSCAESRTSVGLQQTLNEVIAGTTKRLNPVPAEPAETPRPPRGPYRAVGAAVVLVLAAFGGLTAYALSGSPDRTPVAVAQVPQVQPPTPPAPAPPVTQKPPAPTPPVAQRPPVTPEKPEAGPRPPVASFDATALLPFREQFRTTAKASAAGARENVTIRHTGAGKRPAGWWHENYRDGTVGELAVETVGGFKAIGFATLTGEKTTMLITPTFLSRGPGLSVTVEYLTESGAGEGMLKFRQKVPAPPAGGSWWVLGKLPATGGRWATREFRLDAKSAQEGQFEFHVGGLEPGKMLWVKSYAVSAAPPAKPAAAAPRAAAYAFTAESLPDFREQFRSAPRAATPGAREPVVLGRTGGGKLPEGWHRENSRDDTVSEVSVESVGGVKAVGLTRLSGVPSSMLMTPPFGPADAPLALAIEYRVEGTEGAAAVRLSSDSPTTDLAKLPATDGKWVTREVVVRPQSRTTCRLEFHTSSLPIGKTLWVKSLRVAGGGGAAEAPATAEAVAPGGGTVLYFASFDKLEPYREKSSGTKLENGTPVVGTVLEREGDGRLPAGWGPAWSWDRAAVQEFRAAVHNGSMGLGFKTVSGKNSTMLFSPVVKFPDGAVRVRLDYAAGGNSANKGHVRFRQTLPTFGEVYNAADVPTTSDAWETSDFALDTHGATGGVLEFHTSKLPTGETFWLKSVTVYQPAE